MATICDYSNPERHITDELVRQPTGDLFSYNPEFYELASGLYGPGAIYCWLLLLASLTVSWTIPPKVDADDGGADISTDLLAVLAYPIFATMDALVQVMRILGVEDRGLALFCLRHPNWYTVRFTKPITTRLDLRDISPKILSLGQSTINLSGPLSICYSFQCFVVIYFLASTFMAPPAKWNNISVRITSGYVFLAATIIHLSLGSWDIYLAMQEFTGQILLAFTSATTLLFVAVVLGCFGLVLASCIKKDTKGIREGLKKLVVILFLGGLLDGIMISVVDVRQIGPVPDSGISIKERDQIATLIVWIGTLVFTVYRVWLRWVSRDVNMESGSEELQALGSEEEAAGG